MAAVNKDPWVKNLNGANKLVFPGRVQAGATQAIKRGEICTYDETTNYFIPADAVADRRYSLAICDEEQKSADLERYVNFVALRPEDVFEFILDAAAAVALGDGLEITVSDSQKLTRDVDGDAVAFSIDNTTYPETGTTLTNISYVQCTFNPVYSYWMQRVLKERLERIIVSAGNMTPKIEDCGAIIHATAAQTITLPNANVPVGWNIQIVVGVDGNIDIDPKPDTAGIYVVGALQADGKYMRMSDIGDFVKLVWDGTNWIAVNSLSGADGDVSIEG